MTICQKCAIRTKIKDRVVVQKHFIQFIIGDTAGHNNLCLKFQTSAKQPSRTCHCTREMLSEFDRSNCYAKTERDIIDARGNQEKLRNMSQCY